MSTLTRHAVVHAAGEATRMLDPSRSPDAKADAVRRWAVVLGVVVAVVALLVVAMLVVRGVGGHTPPRHGGAGGGVPASSVPAHTRPQATDDRAHGWPRMIATAARHGDPTPEV